jgi:hypothetical protein
MSHVGDDFKVDDGFNILNLRVKEADRDGALQGIASTYDPMDQVIRDGIYEGGRKVISFSGVLQHGIFPLPEILQMAQRLGADEMRRPVEIEFACNLMKDERLEMRNERYDYSQGMQGNHTSQFSSLSSHLFGSFYLLQIRPIVDSKQVLDEDLSAIPDEQCLLRSHNSLGHGISEDVVDVVYVKTDDNFTAVDNPYIADEIEQINKRFLRGEFKASISQKASPSPSKGGGVDMINSTINSAEKSVVISNQTPPPSEGLGEACAVGEAYILIGPGRWGSSDPWLGIPVKWPHISAARVIVEAGLKNYHVDPSQGTHFFQNLTSFGVGYFTINTFTGDGILKKEVLDSMPAVEETQHVRHVRFARPLRIMMDGMKQQGVVLLPPAEDGRQ